jgi:Glycosyltransferases, probably involved in cell wall biogenesis
MQSVLQALYVLFVIVEIIVAIYILVPFWSLCSYLLIRLLGIKRPYDRKPFITDKNFDYGIIITAHQEVEFVFPLVDSILKQTYPHFYIYVVADDCDTSKLVFGDPRVIILKPEPALNAKTRSIHYGIQHFQKKHDAIIIFDVDNLIHPRFLEVINNHFRKGYRVVQADFKPKNTDSNYARMDAIGDMIAFFIDREAKMRLGLSAHIWGSGIAFDYDLYAGILYRDGLGGFDKKLQAHLMLSVPRIAFAPDAILYDEKVSSGKTLENQRARWIQSYFKYFKESWVIFVKGLKNFDINLVYFGFILLRPPLFIVMGAAFLFTAINFFIEPPAFWIWLAVLASFVLSFAGIVLMKSKDWRYLKTMLFLPGFVFRQVLGLLKMKKAKKSFLKTPHTKLLYIEDLIGDTRAVK